MWFIDRIKEGVVFTRNHQQILLTLLLLILIPLAFLLSGQKFLEVSRENQERLEKDRIGLMHDALIPSIQAFFNDPAELNEIVRTLANQNTDIVAFEISEYNDGVVHIRASLDNSKIGKIDEVNDFLYRTSALQLDSSLIFETEENNERRWKAVRALVSERNEVTGFIYTEVSMEYIDTLIASRVREAYVYLGILLLFILILLLNHARIIDYVALYTKLQEADRMKDEFISMTAHELKTPLTAIRGYASLIEEKPSEGKELGGNITKLVNQLVNLIEDLLDVTRIQQQKIALTIGNVNMTTLLQDVVDSLKPVSDEKGLTVTFESEKNLPSVKGDNDRLRQVFINLLSNSIKYTEHGSISVKANATRNAVTVRIMDTGIGIAAPDQSKMFSKFFRAKNEKTQTISGTGLGMWITQQLVEMMGGTIGIESIENVGTHVIVTLPRV